MEFTVTLDSNNSDLLSVMNNSEQQWSEAEHLRQKLLQERDEMCEQAMQLRSSIERQMKEKEQLSQEVGMERQDNWAFHFMLYCYWYRTLGYMPR